MIKQQDVNIFLDLDGVIADFDTHARTQGKMKPGGKPDYDAMDLAWWETMPAFEGARHFYDELRKIGNVRFLTGPVPLVACFAGKAKWVTDFVPERNRWALQDLIICNSKDKKFLARPGHILIDDRANNIKEWTEAGGTGILHEGDFALTLQKTRAAALKKTVPLQKPPAP